jgi:hypothetical protein
MPLAAHLHRLAHPPLQRASQRQHVRQRQAQQLRLHPRPNQHGHQHACSERQRCDGVQPHAYPAGGAQEGKPPGAVERQVLQELLVEPVGQGGAGEAWRGWKHCRPLQEVVCMGTSSNALTSMACRKPRGAPAALLLTAKA